MKFVLIGIIFLVIGISKAKRACFFQNFTNNFQPAFYQKIDNQTIFVPAVNNTISIPDGGSVAAYCSGGFRSFKVGGEIDEATEEIIIHCKNSTISAKMEEEIYSEGVSLQCNKPIISLHSLHTLMCGEDKSSYIMGMEYNAEKIALAEICYDFDNMQLKYIYHKAARRIPILSQEKNNSVISAEYHNPVEPITNNLTISEEEIRSQTKVLFGSIAGAVEYVYDHLVPLDSFDPYVTDSMETTSYLTKILWWKPLKDGNWRLFLDLLKKHAPENGYNVITGVSGAVTDLEFEFNGLTKTPPKLIWSYLTLNSEQDNNYNSSFVVVGYNTPFFDKITSYEFCKSDICERIPWMKPLLETQKKETFGYIVCYTPEEAKKFIPEIPTNIDYLGQLIPAKNNDALFALLFLLLLF